MSLYSTFLERVALPAFYGVRGRGYSRNRAFLEASQWWPLERLREFQLAELRKLVRFSFESVPYYREKYKAAGFSPDDLKTLDDYSKLPVLTREEVNGHRDALRSSGYTGRVYSHATGGSSGVPTRFYVSMESYDWRYAATQRVYSWSGCRLGERSAYLWGAPVGQVSALSRWKTTLYRAYQRQMIFNTFRQTSERWEDIYKKIRRFRPCLLVGYVSSLEQFSQFLLDNNLRLEGIKAIIAAAEPVFPPFRELAERSIGAPVFNTYGSREFMSIGGECDLHRGIHVNAENLLVETALPPSAGASEILITDLHNYGMPFLRYSIGDVGILDDSKCGCGRGLPRIGAIEGRVLDVLRVADGRVVPGEFFPHLLKEIPEVREFQVRQTARDHIVLSLVLRTELSHQSRAMIENEVRNAIGSDTKVELRQVDEIPRLASGKRRVTVGLEG